MASSLLLRRVNLLEAPDRPPRMADVRIEAGRLAAIEGLERAGSAPGESDPAENASPLQTTERTIEAKELWLGPCLVDPHSVLEDPWQGRAETLGSLAAASAAGGYGTVALLPWAHSWRDRPERLALPASDAVRFPCWGSFSVDGADRELAPHADQLAAGAIGLAAGMVLPPLDLLERGLRLGEMEERPVLLAPRDADLARRGFVRERVEALRAGWPLDPSLSETLPLQLLLALTASLTDVPLRVMNLSTAEGVALLRGSPTPLQASVSWWHLIADSGSLDPAEEGWRVVPSLGGAGDRQALLEALEEGRISAVAVHHLPLDAEEQLLPLDQRRPGVAGHGLVLPLLWSELVGRRGWSPQRLWERLCWGPSRFLGLEPECLTPGSRRWCLFDPGCRWLPDGEWTGSLAANRPLRGRTIEGRVVACGLSAPADWALPGGPWR